MIDQVWIHQVLAFCIQRLPILTDLAITTLIWLSISSSLSTSFISCISPTLRLHPIAGIAGQEKNTSIHAPVNELSLVVWIILQ